MPKRLIVGKFPIQPSDILIDYKKGFSHLWNAFDESETEVSAYWIVKLCQKKGGWVPFTHKEINALYRETFPKGESFSFNRLVLPGQVLLNGPEVFMGGTPKTEPVGGGWIVLGADNKYYITDDFVNRCFKSSPNPESAQTS